MESTKIVLKKIYEHDIDLLILEEFVCDKDFARIFLTKAGLDDSYTVVSVHHSLMDSDGESDITIILQYGRKKIALLIEDKIDAVTMPEQSRRYHRRAKAAVARGEYDNYFVMLAAPAAYHREHANDANANYQYRVTYEELLAYFSASNSPRAAFKSAVIRYAITEKENGYQVQEDIAVTEFWMKLREFCKIRYPSLCIVGADAPKGSSACWPEFRTSLKNIKVIYKSQKGFIDLEFPGYGPKERELYTLTKAHLTEQMQITKTGKSASIRLSNPRWQIDFSQPFDRSALAMDEVLQAVSTLCSLASKLNYYDLY